MPKRLALLVAFAVACAAAAGTASAQAPPDSASGAAAPAFTPVTWERLVNAADEPQNWLMYSATFDSQRHSRLEQVHTRNVDQLELKWAYQIPEIDRAETTPLVVDGVMFVTEAPSNAVALDAATGPQYWRYEHELPDDLRICCGRNNRGVAILGETLYMSTLDAHLVAIDARTAIWSGTARWRTTKPDTARRRRRSSSRIRWSPASPAASTASGASSTPTTRRPASRSGAPGRSRDRITRTTGPGPATPGARAAPPPGSPAPTTRSWTSSTGARATRGPTGTATSAWVTTSTPTRPSPSAARPGTWRGTSSSRRTTCTTGTPSRSRFSATSCTRASGGRS